MLEASHSPSCMFSCAPVAAPDRALTRMVPTKFLGKVYLVAKNTTHAFPVLVSWSAPQVATGVLSRDTRSVLRQ